MIAPKIFLLFHGRMPSERAASLWAAKTAETIAESGISTTLIVSGHDINGDPFESFRLKRDFDFLRLRHFDIFWLPIPRLIAFAISITVFALTAVVHLLRHAEREDIIFSNEPLVLFLASFFFRNCFYEIHVFPDKKRFFFRILLPRMCGVVTINEWLAGEIERVYGVPRARIAIARSGVNISQFDIPVSTSEARKSLALPADTHIVLYTGHLYQWKGVDTLAEASVHLPEALVVFVGGMQKDIENFTKKYGQRKNIRIVGYMPHEQVPIWQKAADVLVLPNTAKEDISKYYTSPMKLFEYMASERPIVASRLPSILEILSEKTAVLVEPDNSKALAESIAELLADSSHGETIASAARGQVAAYSWEKRGESIAKFVRRLAN